MITGLLRTLLGIGAGSDMPRLERISAETLVCACADESIDDKLFDHDFDGAAKLLVERLGWRLVAIVRQPLKGKGEMRPGELIINPGSRDPHLKSSLEKDRDFLFVIKPQDPALAEVAEPEPKSKPAKKKTARKAKKKAARKRAKRAS